MDGVHPATDGDRCRTKVVPTLNIANSNINVFLTESLELHYDLFFSIQCVNYLSYCHMYSLHEWTYCSVSAGYRRTEWFDVKTLDKLMVYCKFLCVCFSALLT